MRNTFQYRLIYLILFLFIILLSACNSKKDTRKKTEVASDYKEIKDTRIKFNYYQSFEIKEIKKGKSISDIYVLGIGFQNSSNTIKFNDVYPFESFFIADIDCDGFEELYIITRSVGSGAYVKILGITSNKGKSYKNIYVPEYDNSLDIKFKYLEGYMGHDKIYIQNKKLYREFPVFKPIDTNRKPTGGTRRILYMLNEYNNSFSLQVENSEVVN